MIITKEQRKAFDLSTLFIWFIIYSNIGWIYETLYCSIGVHKIVNRGFLYGPLCPIYGLSILTMILLLSGRCRSILTLFLSCAVISSVLEYISSLWMEYVFGRRWWDYSDQILNINGRVCLGAAVLFGACGVVVIRFLHPAIVRCINQNFSPATIKMVDKVILSVFLLDILVSFQMSLH
ncbi:MAG TPA: putative ABC transporter permease [Mobilitalea sp.]|nr:putative ABC transporter permease [Mobilitalea sp.]